MNFGIPAKIDSQAASTDISMQVKHWKPSDIAGIKKATGKAVIVKGIMSVEDALSAVNLGADAIWVSNTGGRAIDT